MTTVYNKIKLTKQKSGMTKSRSISSLTFYPISMPHKQQMNFLYILRVATAIIKHLIKDKLITAI